MTHSADGLTIGIVSVRNLRASFGGCANETKEKTKDLRHKLARLKKCNARTLLINHACHSLPGGLGLGQSLSLSLSPHSPSLSLSLSLCVCC